MRVTTRKFTRKEKKNRGYEKSFSFSLIAKGAAGGLGSGGIGSSRGSIVLTVLELHKDEDIYILVGMYYSIFLSKNFLTEIFPKFCKY